MKALTTRVVFLASLVLAAASAMWAGSTDSMKLTGYSSTQLDGYYVGSYSATVNGVSTSVVSDDYADQTYLNETWNANSNSYSNLSFTKFASEYSSTYVTMYEEAAWLTEQMVSPANSSQVGEIQYAIWSIFDASAMSNLWSYNLGDGIDADAWLLDAELQSYTTSEFSNFTIYTPANPSNASCGGKACPTGNPQEFMVMGGAPEPGSLATLVADLALFACVALILRRRRLLSFSS
jgi:hypothetical protein